MIQADMSFMGPLVLLVLKALGLLHAIDVKESGCARVALPIKILLGVAVATEVKSSLLARGAVSEGNVVVGDIVEKLDLVLVQEQTSSNGMDRRVTPSFVEEATILV